MLRVPSTNLVGQPEQPRSTSILHQLWAGAPTVIDNAVSLFSGIGGFELALQNQGIRNVASVEIDKHCHKVLEARFPLFAHYTDVNQVTGKDLLDAGFNPNTGVITAGFPCQDLSVAGRRAGLEGERSKLFWQIERLLSETKAQSFIIENVPGLLTSNSGRDFGIVLTALAQLGYSVAWRVLDAQNFGVPQRRRRVFLVGHLTDRDAPRKILFERDSEPRDNQTLGTPRPRTTTNATSSAGTPSWAVKTTRSGARDAEGNLPPEVWTEQVVHPTLNLNDLGESRAVALVFMPHRWDGARVLEKTSNTLLAFMGTGGNNTPMVAYGLASGRSVTNTLTASLYHHGSVVNQDVNDGHLIIEDTKPSSVRRITPVECERLQGFPDGWTEGQVDSHRYKQLGNAVAVPVVEWIVNRMVANA